MKRNEWLQREPYQQDIEASPNEFEGLGYTGIFVFSLLIFVAAGIFYVWL